MLSLTVKCRQGIDIDLYFYLLLLLLVTTPRSGELGSTFPAKIRSQFFPTKKHPTFPAKTVATSGWWKEPGTCRNHFLLL